MPKSTKVWVGPVRKPRKRATSTQMKLVEPDINKKTKGTAAFVLVYKTSLSDEAHFKVETFLFNLEHKGFQIEAVESEIDDEINFITITAPNEVLLRFAKLFGIELSFQNVEYKIKKSIPYKLFANELTKPNYYGSIYPRARETFSGATPSSITNAEKGLIIYKVLSRNPYGLGKHEYGIDKLLAQDVFVAAYPLHDGPFKWTEEGPLNDRQLLTRYWTSIKNWYKKQPIDVVEKYFGPEVSFYFAWLGFYNKMLVPAAITGFLFFTVGYFCFSKFYSVRSEEVCKSDILLCPRCLDPHCKFEPLKSVCFHAKIMTFFDNPLVVTFAALMSIWSTVFLELWRREEAILQIRWNLRSAEADCSMRSEFQQKTKTLKYSTITGDMEPYMPIKQVIGRYLLTTSVIALLVLLVVLGIFAVMLYIKTVSVVLSKSQDKVLIPVGLIASLTGSMISVVFIISFELMYQKLAMWLTELENHRTQIDFDNSYTYKSYALAFVNNYSVIFYIAFLKARFYTYPGDRKLFSTLGGIGSDLCDPSGCIVELGMQIMVTLFGKKLFSTAMQFFAPKIKIFFYKMKRHKQAKKTSVENTPQWECDYVLNPVVKYHVMDEYMQMIIQYGFVTFFVAAFPPAPLLALLNNVIELRVDAYKMTHSYRRPVSFKVPNLAAWNGILHGITYIGVATNAFVIAFTSDFVQRAVYRFSSSRGLVGYIGSILSVYNVNEFPTTFVDQKNITVCYYPGKRYPPSHPYKYQLTHDFWYTLTIKFLAVVVFEHVVMLVTGIISYVIPSIPFSVKEHINYHRDQLKAIKLQALRETYLKNQDEKKADVFKDI